MVSPQQAAYIVEAACVLFCLLSLFSCHLKSLPEDFPIGLRNPGRLCICCLCTKTTISVNLHLPQHYFHQNHQYFTHNNVLIIEPKASRR